MFNQPIDSPIVSPLAGPWGHGQSGVPGDPIGLWLTRDGLTESIGLSISDYLLVDPDLWPIFFVIVDGVPASKRDDVDIVALALASPYLNNQYMVGSAAKGLALYPLGTANSVLAKARRYFDVLTYTGMTLYGDIRTYGLPKTPNWFLDSVDGLDTNDGLTINTPLKTPTALMAKTIAEGDAIGLKAGGYSRDELDVTGIDNVHVVGYGSGRRFILDAADIAANEDFSLVGGRTNTYLITWTHSIFAESYLSVWVDGVRLTYVADEATVEATPGSFSIPYPSTSPTTIKVHPPGSTNPVTDGKLYEISRRDFGLIARSCTGTVVHHIHTARNGGNDGSMVVDEGADIFNCLGEDGTKHNIFITGGKCRQTVAWKLDTSARVSQTMFIASAGAVGDLTVEFDYCVAKADNYRVGVNGFYHHTNGTCAYALTKFTHNTSYLCTSAFSGANSAHGYFLGNYATGCIVGFGGTYTLAEYHDDFAESTTEKCIDKGIYPSATTLTVDGFRCTVNANNTGCVYSNAANLTVTNSVFNWSAGSLTFAVRHYAAGNFTVKNSIYSGLSQGHRSDHASSVVTADTNNNVIFPSTMDHKISNVAYADFAAYRTAFPALDVNSITNAPLFVNPASSNFALQAGSPAIAIGAGLLNSNVVYTPIPSDETLAAM